MGKLFLAVSLSLILSMGCKNVSNEKPKETTEEAMAPDAIVKLAANQQADAKKVYNAWCSGCHGEKGRGDGPAAVVLEVKPRDFVAESFKIRSTASGQKPTRKDLFETVTRGLPGTAMPSFSFLSNRIAGLQWITCGRWRTWIRSPIRRC